MSMADALIHELEIEAATANLRIFAEVTTTSTVELLTPLEASMTTAKHVLSGMNDPPVSPERRLYL